MIDVRLGKLGDVVESVLLLEWLVAVGERVDQGVTLAVVEADKADVEIVAPEGGMVSEILVPAGGEASVGTVLCRISPLKGNPQSGGS